MELWSIEQMALMVALTESGEMEEEEAFALALSCGVTLRPAAPTRDLALSVNVRVRSGNRRRDRGFAIAAMGELTDFEFTRMFRLSRPAFFELLDRLPQLQKDDRMAIVSSGSGVAAATRLAVTLRFLAGGSWCDLMFAFGVAKSTFFGVVEETMQAINGVLEIKFPINSEADLRRIEEGFAAQSGFNLRGCVMAIDGLIVKTRRPYKSECENVLANMNRKGFWGTHVLAGCDSSCRFLFVSQKCTGATHDSLAFECTSLYRKLHKLPEGCFIIGDEAFVCTDKVLTPWPYRSLDPWRDSFNYHLSRMRQDIERAFGILVQRWCIFWRPLRMAMSKWSLVIVTAMKLHNYCMDHSINVQAPVNDDLQPGDSRDVFLGSDITGFGWENRRRWEEYSSLREQLTAQLLERGITRPMFG
jgi:hypothetical protein